MIADQMNISVRQETAVRVNTVDCSLLPNSEVLPYTVGYLPSSFVRNSNFFKMNNLDISVTATSTNINGKSIANPDRGIPFLWHKQIASTENISVNVVSEDGGSTWGNSTLGQYNNINAFYSWNLESGINSISTANRPNYFAKINFEIYLIVAKQNVANPELTDSITQYTYTIQSATTTETATQKYINPITLEYTLKQTIAGQEIDMGSEALKANQANAVTVITGDDGVTYRYTWRMSPPAVSCETYGTCFMQNNYRLSPNNSNVIPVTITGELTSAIPGYIWKRVTNSVNVDNLTIDYTQNSASLTYNANFTLYRNARTNWFSVGLVRGCGYEDIQYLVCALPFFYVREEDATEQYPVGFYCGEYTDDFVLTGNIIKFENARDWQKNLNPQTNNFNWEDIPAPVPVDGSSSGGNNINLYGTFLAGSAYGLSTMYAMTSGQVQSLAKDLWAKIGSEDWYQNLIPAFLNTFTLDASAILQYITSLRVYPFELTNLIGFNYGSDALYIGTGNSPLVLASGRLGIITDYGQMLSNDSQSIFQSTLTIIGRYGDFRDYEPYTTVTVHVPYCGSAKLNASEVMNKTLTIRYGVDFSTGAMVATIGVISDTTYPVAILSGQVGADIQLTASNSMEQIQRVASAIGGSISGGTTGAAAIGGWQGAVAGAVVGGAQTMLNSPAIAVHETGVTNGFASMLAPQQVYATIEYSNYEVPPNYSHYYGNRVNITEKLENLYGFTVCENVDVSGIVADDDELIEIKQLLESGVYL